MKKIVLFFILIMGVLNAKQFAYCNTNTIGNPANVDCWTGTSSSMKADSVNDMYKNGWRLITVNTVYRRYNSSYFTYFYFEK